MRIIDKLIIHCSDTPKSMDVGAKEIGRWHEQRGFNKIGYHYVIRRDGSLEVGRMESVIGAHCFGQNRRSLGVCLVGRGEYTKKQFTALKRLSDELKNRYVGLKIKGHYSYSKKTCPMFNVEEWLSPKKIEEVNDDGG